MKLFLMVMMFRMLTNVFTKKKEKKEVKKEVMPYKKVFHPAEYEIRWP